MRLTAERGNEPHLGVAHLYIHAMEMSPHPERALRASDALRNLATDAGHFLHLPSHIDVLCGDYHAALAANERAIVADRKYLEREGPLNFYTLSRTHNYHFKLYAAMFLGRYGPALDAANELIATMPDELLRMTAPPMADWLEGFVGMKVHVLVRFGRWEAILDEPLPGDPELYRVTTAMLHYGKGVAHAARGRIDAAEAEQRRFTEAFARVPDSRKVLDGTLGRASQHPNNVWSLHGYMECLRRLGEHAEAACMQKRLDLAAARADVEIGASCFCRVGDGCCE